MSDVIIKVENVSKLYRLGEVGTGTLSHDFNRWWHRVRGKEDPYLKIGQTNDRTKKGDSDYSWALKDVSFEVKRGEVLGIIGRNGAGKSTLLKILSRVTTPTSGEIKVKGRIASLLEVGTGFNPELTGRDNIYLNGAILGMRKREIDQKFDEIVAFSEVERYIDTPVKRYSSGMYVRLAFAVAAHLEPEILIVDEVLAVGDAEFQKKCLGKMKNVSKEGRTVLFVSHNMSAISQLTKNCVLLAKGEVEYMGNSQIAVEQYFQPNCIKDQLVVEVESKNRVDVGNGNAKILTLRFDRASPNFSADEDFSFLITIRSLAAITRLRTSFTIFSSSGLPVGGVFAPDNHKMKCDEVAEFRVWLQCPNLAPGSYYCWVGIGRGDPQSGVVDYDVVADTLHFNVLPKSGIDGTVSNWHDIWGRIIFQDLLFERIKS